MCILIPASQLRLHSSADVAGRCLIAFWGVRAMKLLDQVRGLIRAKHFSHRTEKCYVQWIVRFIHFHGVKHPNAMDPIGP